jgi:lysophospholipase-3
MRKTKFLLFLILLCAPYLAYTARISMHPACHPQRRGLLNQMTCSTENDIEHSKKIGAQFMHTKIMQTEHKRSSSVKLDPIILVPGLSGTALEAKLEGVQGPHWICRSNCDWYRAWISFSELVPEVVDCWFHTLDVLYDEKNNTYSNNKGVSMRPIDWGGVKGVDYLDRIFGYPVWFSAYFAPLIAALEGAGYVTGQNLRAAPYDWRLPNHHDDFVPKLKALIEETYYSNGNSAVHLLCHSMGNLRLLDFLDDQDKAWKDKFVTSWIAVSAPWSGSPKAIRTLISGDNYDFKFGSVPIINQIKIRDLARQAG